MTIFEKTDFFTFIQSWSDMVVYDTDFIESGVPSDPMYYRLK